MYFTKAQVQALWFITIVFAAGVILQFGKIYIFPPEPYDFREFDSLFTAKRDSLKLIMTVSDTLSPVEYQKITPEKKENVVLQQFPVNINTATVGELEALPRIGPAMAMRILEYRQQFGRFRSKEEIMKVRGIGQKTYIQLENLIVVE